MTNSGIEATPVLGKTKYFSVDEIGTARPAMEGYKVFDRRGKLLFRFETNQENWENMVRYLKHYQKL